MTPGGTGELGSAEIRIRDPFVLDVDGGYVLYGTTDRDPWTGPGTGFDCYTSADLIAWTGPIAAFRAPEGFWGTSQFWAPEVYAYDGRFFMFATFADSDGSRGTQVLVADRATGPFLPHSDGPVTPTGWRCLDGTLYLDPAGDPWIVYCREWLDVHDGQVLAQRLEPSLRATDGDPHLLFTASSARWTRPLQHDDGRMPGQDFVTDGPSLYRLPGGALAMIWSSHGPHGYAVGSATSASGDVRGPWHQDPEPLWEQDGGHGMILQTRSDDLLLVIHHPNTTPDERIRFVPLEQPTPNSRTLRVAAPKSRPAS